MREPDFWYGSSSALSALLSPVAAVYGAIAQRRMGRAGERVGIPVICIGNYHLGGAGKTPTTLQVAQLLRDAGETPIVVSRGYGGDLSGPVRVEVRHRASDVGDEPLMMSGHVPVIVARDRAAGAHLAKAQGASVILLDDGFQNPALAKDASLIVIDGIRALGNGRVFPAGPLRAPLEPQLARTDVLIVIGAGNNADEIANEIFSRSGLVLRAWFEPAASSLAKLQGERVLAFAGIGDPARFFATLRQAGIDVAEERIFADHHRFTRDELVQLAGEAKSAELLPVTTEKDMARIASDPALASMRDSIVPFSVKLKIDDEAALRAFLRARLDYARKNL